VLPIVVGDTRFDPLAYGDSDVFQSLLSGVHLSAIVIAGTVTQRTRG
jgi:hypothetical protein